MTPILLTAPERLTGASPPLTAANWREVPGPDRCRCEWDFLEAGQPWYLRSRHPACRMHTAPLGPDNPGWPARAEAMAHAARVRKERRQKAQGSRRS